MAFTRFHDDEARIIRRLQQQTDQERWYLDVPGNGTNPAFMLDPHIIPQKWGGNLWTNVTDIHSSLLGIDKQLNRDCLEKDKYKRQHVYTSPIDYPTCETLTTEQSRAIMPAWTARDLQQNHAYILPNNPQANVEIPFNNYVSTRILEKDHFKREMPNIPQNSQLYTLPTEIYNMHYKPKNGICHNDCSKII
jgi:hypothetical protein